MKTLNLTSYGVKEIKEVEMSEVNGGFWEGLAWLIVGMLVSDLMSDPKGVGEAISAGAQAARDQFR